METATAGWLPVTGPPVAVVTWFDPSGAAVALLASWVAIINGRPPEVRVGCPCRGPDRERLPLGLDFAVNVPDGACGSALTDDMRLSAEGPVIIRDVPGLATARMVHAPLLAGCGLQLECATGRIVTGEWEPELAGELLLLHRGGLFIDPRDNPDFCALAPLRPFFPS